MNENVYDNLFGEQDNSLNSYDDTFFVKEEKQDSFLLELSDDDLDQIAGGEQLHNIILNLK